MEANRTIPEDDDDDPFPILIFMQYIICAEEYARTWRKYAVNAVMMLLLRSPKISISSFFFHNRSLLSVGN